MNNRNDLIEKFKSLKKDDPLRKKIKKILHDEIRNEIEEENKNSLITPNLSFPNIFQDMNLMRNRMDNIFNNFENLNNNSNNSSFYSSSYSSMSTNNNGEKIMQGETRTKKINNGKTEESRKKIIKYGNETAEIIYNSDGTKTIKGSQKLINKIKKNELLLKNI
jgi:hypothetical protein